MTVVLMEVGSFYELYAVDDVGIDLQAIGNLLNIQVTRRNKNIIEVSKSNHLLAGFPSYCLEKFTNVLVDHGYTVVVVSQITPPPKPKRGVTAILSPGTRLDNLNPHKNSFLMSVCVDDANGVLAAGMSYIDISTGATYAFETGGDMVWSEIERVIDEVEPVEIVFFGKLSQSPRLGCLRGSRMAVHTRFNVDSEVFNHHYQRQILCAVYPNHGLLSVVEFLGLERHPFALASFVELLRFTNKHAENVLTCIKSPKVLYAHDHLYLSHNTSKQLDVFNTQASLEVVLNRCKTAIGKRYFKQRLTKPMLDTAKIQQCLDRVSVNINYFETIRDKLKNVSDLERLFRRMQLLKLQPLDFLSIHDSVNTIQSLLTDQTLQTCWDPVLTQNCKTALHLFCNAYTGVLDLSRASRCTLSDMENVFVQGVHPDIDELQKELDKCINDVYSLAKDLDSTVFRVESSDKEGYHLSITSKRFATFKQTKGEQTFRFGDEIFKARDLTGKPVSSSSTQLRVRCPGMAKTSERINQIKLNIAKLASERYIAFLSSLRGLANTNDIVDFVAHADYDATNAANAVEFGYCKPTVDASATRSYVSATDLRHPIIERINTLIPYVPNDISIGHGCNEFGMLLYGVNASGKSSFMKSVGLAMIMACAGMYVPCRAMTFHPYSKIFSRIPTGDDIFRGHSTFTNEVSELRIIMRYADERSLVIGDELCSGTESISATAIVGAGILTLLEKNASFIFASHLHTIVDLPEIKDRVSHGLSINHLSVTYDSAEQKLIYDRKLKPGNGNTLYGLEVCRALDLAPDFMSKAQSIRKHLLSIEPNIVSTKTSRYNKRLFKTNRCSVCKDALASEVHHIVEQKHANGTNGLINNRFHKNTLHNLVYLCQTCHNKVHNSAIKIHGYLQTTNGIELFTEKNFGP